MATTTNLAEVSQGMAEDALSKIIVEAIQLTRGMGLRWLWIDAFCIIQDDPSDKARQLPIMGDIYRHAHVTICSSIAPSVEGFLKDGICSFGFTRSPPDTPLLEPANVLAAVGPNLDPAFERAWIMQERLLSPYLLIFSGNGMSWRCQTHGHHERAPVDELDYDGWSRLLAQVYLDEVPNQTNAIDAIDTRQIYDSWASLIHDYSRCFLSVDNDKLPAIAGLAELCGRKFGTQLGTYIAGVWSAYLIESLRWRVRPAKKNFPQTGVLSCAHLVLGLRERRSPCPYAE
jgi:hypothetical protein